MTREDRERLDKIERLLEELLARPLPVTPLPYPVYPKPPTYPYPRWPWYPGGRPYYGPFYSL